MGDKVNINEPTKQVHRHRHNRQHQAHTEDTHMHTTVKQ